MLLSREQYEKVHYFLSQYKEKRCFYDFMANEKVSTIYWGVQSKVHINDVGPLVLYSPNLSEVVINFKEDTVSKLLTNKSVNVMDQLVIDTLANFNIEDYYRDEIKPIIHNLTKDMELSIPEIHALVMDDGDFYREVEFELKINNVLRP